MNKHRENWMAEAGAKRFLPNSKGCFVCGEENAAGLQTRFYAEGGQVKMPFRGRAEHCGFPGTVHGGITAAALDECMGWAAARALGVFCVTAELKLRYMRPVPAERSLTVTAELTRHNRRMAEAIGMLVDGDGTEYVRAEGRFLPMSEEETRDVEKLLQYHDGDLRFFGGIKDEA